METAREPAEQSSGCRDAWTAAAEDQGRRAAEEGPQGHRGLRVLSPRGFHRPGAAGAASIERRRFESEHAQHLLSLGDQGLSSLTNFIAMVLMARIFSPTEFGLAAMLVTAAMIMIGVGRGMTGEPALTRVTRAGSAAEPASAALAVGIVAGGVLVAAFIPFGPTYTYGALVLGVSAPLLLAQDSLRFAVIARRRAELACVSDGLWLVSLVLAFSVTERLTTMSVPVALTVFAASCGCGLLPFWPLIRSARSARPSAWFRRTKDLGSYYTLDFLARTGASSATVFLVAALSGLTAAGGLRAGQSLFGPVRVLIWSASLAFVPAFRQHIVASRSVASRIRCVSAGLAGASVLIGVVALLMPPSTGRLLLGGTWAATRPVVLPLTVVTAAFAWSAGSAVGLRAYEAAKESMTTRIIQGVLTVPAGAVGAVLAGARGGAWGLAIAALLSGAVWELRFRSVLRARAIGCRPSDQAVPGIG